MNICNHFLKNYLDNSMGFFVNKLPGMCLIDPGQDVNITYLANDPRDRLAAVVDAGGSVDASEILESIPVLALKIYGDALMYLRSVILDFRSGLMLGLI